jgi:hypothetical protein
MTLRLDLIEKLVKSYRLTSPAATVGSLRRELEVWWCFQYNRPLKDPLLQQYTLEELAYEYFIHHFREQDNDPLNDIRQKKNDQDDLEWAQRMTRKLKEQPPKEPDKVLEAKQPDPPTMLNLQEISTNFE